MTQIVEFNVFFKKEPLHPGQYLEGISRTKLLTLGSHFLGFDVHSPKRLEFEAFVQEFFIANLEFKSEVLARLLKMKFEYASELLIINTVSSLEFFEYAFMFGKEENTQSDAEAEKNIFMAYLAFNQTTRSKEDLVFPSVSHLSQIEQAGAAFFTQSYAYSNLVNYDQSELIATQFIKGALFLEFLQKNEKTKNLYDAFLKHYGFSDWKEYLKKFFPFVSGVLNNPEEGYINFTVRPGEQFQKDCEFIDKLILSNENPVEEDHDYLKIRESPLYKIKEGTYRIIFSLFLFEKIYKALYFKLAVLNKTLTGGVPQLKSLIGDEFSEKVLGYEILNSIYQKKYITFSGEESKKLGLESEPDYYVRKGKRVFLFESKDFLIDAKIKTSYDFRQLSEAFEKKLVKDHKKRAILQLLVNCERILKKTFVPDSDYDEDKVIIYPIILLHDNQYNVIGLNQVVNAWFERELEPYKQKGLRIGAIRPVSIINIDTLIYHQDLFRERSLILEDLLDRYIAKSSLTNLRFKSLEHLREIIQDRLLPFSHFLSKMDTVRKKRRFPKMFMKIVGNALLQR